VGRCARILLLAGFASSLLFLAGCASPANPTPTPTPTPTPVADPPKLTCPVAQTVQAVSGIATPVAYGAATAVNGSPPVAVSCVPPSGSLFNVGLSTVTCTATDALQRADSCSFPVTVLAAPTLSITKFLAFGDSITKGEDGNASATVTSSGRFQPAVILPDGLTYPGVLRQDLINRYTAQAPTVFNAGCPGEGITGDDSLTGCGFSTALARFTSYTSTGLFPVVLIMEGTNDLYEQTDTRNLSPTIAGLRQMLGDAMSRGMRPYLATIPPINPLGVRGRTFGSQLVPELNDRIRALGASQGVTVVDVNQVFGNSFALLGPDGLHPTVEGYTRIAEKFLAAIQATLETPAGAAIRPGDLRRSFLRLR
jgi:lysophospholipase L1-like esterase